MGMKFEDTLIIRNFKELIEYYFDTGTFYMQQA